MNIIERGGAVSSEASNVHADLKAVRDYLTRPRADSSWNLWFAKSARELVNYVENYPDNHHVVSIDEAINLFFVVVMSMPEKSFNEMVAYLKRFDKQAKDVITGNDQEAKINYYLERILREVNARDKESLKHQFLQAIYDKLDSNRTGFYRKYSINGSPLKMRKTMDIIETMLKKFNEKFSEEVAREKDLGAVKKEEKTITFANYVGVPEEARDFVSRIKNPQIYKDYNIPLPDGILLAGAPGAGKTYLAQAIAGELDCPFFDKKGSDFTTKKFVGTSTGAIDRIFGQAREVAKNKKKDMVIMFIDEFDAIGSREADNTGAATEAITALLPEIGVVKDGVKVIVIAATNHPENIDPALRRSGRMVTVRITDFGIEGRKELLRNYLNKSRVNKNINLEEFVGKLADVTEGSTPADIKAFVDNAGVIAIKRGKHDSGIDYDCAVRALWNIKKTYREKQLLAERSKYDFTKMIPKELSSHMKNMTFADINAVADKAKEFSEKRPEKTIQDWTLIAIAAQNQLIKINQNRDLIHLCEKIYAPMKIDVYDYPEKVADFSPEQKAAILSLQPEDIFERFERLSEDKYAPLVGVYDEDIGQKI